jgi:hypothetical protein
MRRFATGFIVAAMVLAACGGSSKSSTGSGNPSSGGTTAPSGGNSGGGSNTSSDLAKQKIKIVYTSGTGTSATNLTIAQDGNGKSSFTNSDSSNPSAASTIYFDGKSTVECQGSGSTAQCTAVPAVQAAIVNSFSTLFSTIATAAASVGGGDKSSDTIAGRDASCTKYSASNLIGKLAALPFFKNSTDKPSDYDSSDTATICFDKKSGFVLKLAGTKKGVAQDQLIATSVGDPSDSDFTPPVTPATVPDVSLPGGLTIPTSPGG